MALSEEEQKLLEQMEAALAAEDPKLAHAMRGSTTGRTLHRRRAALAGVGFVAGAVALVMGMQTHWLVSVIGFLVMLAATVTALTAYRTVPPTDNADAGKPKAPTGGSSDRRLMDKMEERWRRRQDEGL